MTAGYHKIPGWWAGVESHPSQDQRHNR